MAITARQIERGTVLQYADLREYGVRASNNTAGEVWNAEQWEIR